MLLTFFVISNPVLFQHFDWSYSMQSMILSSFFWGYVLLMLPSGELAKRFGGKVLITISVSVNAFVSLILPTAAYYVSLFIYLYVSLFIDMTILHKVYIFYTYM